MKLLKKIFIMFITLIVGMNIVNAAPKTLEEAKTYVENKDNGYCVYESGNLVLGVKTNGITKTITTYLWHINTTPSKVVFALRGYEKNKCPTYAMVVGGYVGGDSTWTEAIFLADSESTLNDVFKGSTKYENFERSTSGITYNSGNLKLVNGVGIMTSDANGNSQGSTYTDDPNGEKINALTKVKEEYLNKYDCVYIDEINSIVLGYDKGSSGELYFKGVRTNNFLPPSSSKYTSGFVGEIADNCAKYAIAAQGTYEDKNLYVILRADDSNKLKSSDMAIKTSIVSDVMPNIGKGNGNNGSSDLNGIQIDNNYSYNNMDCYGLLGSTSNPDDPAYWLHMGIQIIRYAGIAALFIFSAIDFIQAIISQDNDALKKAINKTVKRFAFVVILFFVPLILEFILDLFGVYGTCTL